MNYTLDKTETVFQGKVFDVEIEHITLTDTNSKAHRQIAKHPGGALIAAVTDEKKVILVSQFRYPLHETMLELPAGKLDPGEDPQTCAVRELKEETGYTAGEVVKLGQMATTPGFCNEILHIYFTDGITPGEPNREEGEAGMKVYEFTFDELDEKIRRGEIYDGKTVTGIYLAKMHLGL